MQWGKITYSSSTTGYNRSVNFNIPFKSKILYLNVNVQLNGGNFLWHNTHSSGTTLSKFTYSFDGYNGYSSSKELYWFAIGI